MDILWLVRRLEELVKIEHGIREAIIAFNKKISCRVTIFQSPVMFAREGRGVLLVGWARTAVREYQICKYACVG